MVDALPERELETAARILKGLAALAVLDGLAASALADPMALACALAPE